MKKIIISYISVLLILSGCGGSKKIADKKTGNQTQKSDKPEVVKPSVSDKSDLDFETLQYLAKYRNIAKKEMKEYGIPASITLAQGILESQSGKSRLAVEGNNHFGIKCHKDWQGQTIKHDDNEAQECFRKYLNPEESFKDHSRFLAERKRYAFLFRLPKTDYEAWARGLKKAGYATDPTYPDKLIYIIQKYDLAKLDKEVLQEMSVKVDENDTDNEGDNKKKFIYEVQEGETLFTISRKFHIPVKDIQRINNLNDFDIYQGQILVLTETNPDEINNTQNEPEKPQDTLENPIEDVETPLTETTANDTGNYQLHTVKQGETLFSISKAFHINPQDIKEANGLMDDNINVGDVIKLPMDKVIKDVKEEVKEETPVEETPVKDEAVYHIVKPGETLYRIHINYKVPINQLRKLNHLKGNYIKVGQKLRIK
jgi:LysM repeat protein